MSLSNTSPLLSICIPTWNRAETLRKTIESLASATSNLPEGSIELCLSDNASSDQTSNIFLEAESLQIPVRTARLTKTVAFSGNYWSVASLATGRFTWITGDDDTFDSQGLAKLVTILAETPDDLILINSFPWKNEVKSLSGRVVNGLEDYFSTFGIFHASFIGNSIFLSQALQPFFGHSATLDSAYPHMAPVFGIASSGLTRFVNIRPVIVDDSCRSWRARKPLLTAVDMARLATDLAFINSSCSRATCARVYLTLIRSIPRAVFTSKQGTIIIDNANPYQSLTTKNLISCYRALPLFGIMACIISIVSRISASVLRRTSC